MDSIFFSVIMSTYNHPKWLEKAVWSYEFQDFKNFELVIADDGSDHRTKQVVEDLQQKCSFPIKHIWHEDDGFQKCKILNKAITASKGDYLLFTDGDCIARKDFLATHNQHKEQGYFLSGGYYKLCMPVSRKITIEDIRKANCFDTSWLLKQGTKLNFKLTKIWFKGVACKLMNKITPARASWNGMNSSGWRKDILSVNGMNEVMQYGGQDRELGIRLENLGLRSKQIRYSAICLHLDHSRGYATKESIDKNKKICQDSQENKVIKTPYGIEKI